MNKIIYALLAAGILTSAAGCRKYVEILPQQSKVLTLTTDYQQLLYNSTLIEQSYYNPVFAGDDAGSDEITWQNTLNSSISNTYTWAEKIYGSTEEDQDWSNDYKRMYIYNTVITGVMGSTGSDQEKQAALASALVHRGYEYLNLVNIYGKQYDAATASSDPGVPLLMDIKFNTDLTRASVQKVYDQVKTDLLTALPVLPDLPDFNSNPSKSAVYAILARLYLNTREFATAERYADLALGLQNTVYDLNTYKSAPTTYPIKTNNREQLLIKRTTSFPTALPLSTDAVNMYDKSNDLRYTLFTAAGSSISFSNLTTSRAYFKNKLYADGSVFTGPSVPEVTLIKAECEARAGNAATAMGILNTFRKKRYNNAVAYTDLAATTANAALHLVTDERKREFVATGMRWFDQRRLSKDAGFVSTVTRVFKTVTYTLEPGSNRYTFPVADKYIAINPEIIQNPR